MCGVLAASLFHQAPRCFRNAGGQSFLGKSRPTAAGCRRPAFHRCASPREVSLSTERCDRLTLGADQEGPADQEGRVGRASDFVRDSACRLRKVTSGPNAANRSRRARRRVTAVGPLRVAKARRSLGAGGAEGAEGEASGNRPILELHIEQTDTSIRSRSVHVPLILRCGPRPVTSVQASGGSAGRPAQRRGSRV